MYDLKVGVELGNMTKINRWGCSKSNIYAHIHMQGFTILRACSQQA